MCAVLPGRRVGPIPCSARVIDIVVRVLACARLRVLTLVQRRLFRVVWRIQADRPGRVQT